MDELQQQIDHTLRTRFGFDKLRPGQEAVVRSVMQGRDTLAIMPTGGGKSLCYQLPALCMEAGLTVVVSPLIALMKDQVDALQARGIPAAAVNSALGAEEYRQVMLDLARGALRILYVAPERFGAEGFMRRLCEQRVCLLAVDEAHCLSQWGHDFRPDYLRLGRVREALGMPPIVALTATATEAVRQDIVGSLRLAEPAVIISGFGRENLDFAIVHCEGRQEKFARIRKTIARWRTGIIYCSTRKNVMAVYREIMQAGANAVAYHAGLTDEEREAAQNAFISRRADMVVATNAFGMGIDRSDVRFVTHFEIPGSVEAYYQEAGRAGRDGEPAYCELLFNHADLKTQEFFYEGSNPSLSLIRLLYHLLKLRCDPQSHEVLLTVDELTEQLGKEVNPMAVSSALAVLVHAGAIARADVPGKNVKVTRLLRPEASFDELQIDRERLEEKARRDHLKIEAITRYAYSAGCRQKWILDYFGEAEAQPCGHCDACAAEDDAEACELHGEAAEMVRKALAGVARASRRAADGSWQPIYGRSKIMDMLRGAKKASLNQHLLGLSTYGLLAKLTDARMRALFRAMQNAGLVATSGGELPLLTLTPKGEEVMKAQAPVALSPAGWAGLHAAAKPARAGSKTDKLLAALGMGKVDKALYEALAEVRRDFAQEYGMPAYRVMNNETLRALATIKPTTVEGAARIKGIGAWTLSHTIHAFLEVIQEHEGL